MICPICKKDTDEQGYCWLCDALTVFLEDEDFNNTDGYDSYDDKELW